MINNAIIFAAGKGQRLGLKNKHKSLLKFNNKPLIEIIIENLLDIKVKNIVVITGYKSNKFLYLLNKYNEVTIIHNDSYENKSTAYAGYLVREFFQDNTIIISGDMLMFNNFFTKIKYSNIMCAIKKNNNRLDWSYELNNEGNIIGYKKTQNINSLFLGEWSLLSKEWSKAIVKYLEELFQNKVINKYQMVDILIFSALKQNIKIKPYILSVDDQIDIDNINDLKFATLKFNFKKTIK